MFDRFGEYDSYVEINAAAERMLNKGQNESVECLAKENGIDKEIVSLYLEFDIPQLCDAQSAALGKLDIECAGLKPKEIMLDWTEYIRGQILEDEEMALAVRKKGKRIQGCIAALLTWSFKNQIPIEKDILKAANVSAGRVTLGIPGMKKAKEIIRGYYLEGEDGKKKGN